jgi:hypothetical protein
MTDEEESAARSQLKWTREGDAWHSNRPLDFFLDNLLHHSGQVRGILAAAQIFHRKRPRGRNGPGAVGEVEANEGQAGILASN